MIYPPGIITSALHELSYLIFITTLGYGLYYYPYFLKKGTEDRKFKLNKQDRRAEKQWRYLLILSSGRCIMTSESFIYLIIQVRLYIYCLCPISSMDLRTLVHKWIRKELLKKIGVSSFSFTTTKHFQQVSLGERLCLYLSVLVNIPAANIMPGF